MAFVAHVIHIYEVAVGLLGNISLAQEAKLAAALWGVQALNAYTSDEIASLSSVLSNDWLHSGHFLYYSASMNFWLVSKSS